jgi:hypothetical protein
LPDNTETMRLAPTLVSDGWNHCRHLAASLGCASAMAAAAPEIKTEMNVQLPPFIVETTIGPTWRYTEIPRFEILSRCNDLTTERLALAFHRANQLLSLVLPERFQLALDAPRALIFYDEKLWPVSEQKAVSALLRANPPSRPEGVPVPDRVQLEPITGAKLLGAKAGNQVHATDAFFSNLMLTDADTIVTFALVSKSTIDPERSYLTTAYVNNLLLNRAPALSDWFTAGFMRLYDRMNFEDNTVTVKPRRWDLVVNGRSQPVTAQVSPDQAADFGRLATGQKTTRLTARRAFELNTRSFIPGPPGNSGNPTPRDASSVSPDASAPQLELLLPLVEFFDNRAPVGDLELWKEQTELFVRWGLDPANGRTEAFWNWVDLSSRKPATEVLFRECLGMDFSEATRSIIAFSSEHRGIRWVLPKALSQPPPHPFENASPLQIARIKGEWERLEARYVRKNQPDLEEHYVALARRTLRKPYDRGDRDPRLLASLGLLELEAGDQPVARAFLEEAVSGGVVRPRAYYELARLRYDYLFGRSTRNDGKYTAEQSDSMLQPLLAASRQSPPLRAVYELMAHVSSNSVEPPSAEVLAALAQGARLFPGKSHPANVSPLSLPPVFLPNLKPPALLE